MLKLFSKLRRHKVRFAAFTLTLCGAYLLSLQPTTDADWTSDQQILPEVTFREDSVAIKNIRNINYQSTSEYTPAYYDATYDLNALRSVWFIVERLSSWWAGPAHTMLSFEFEGPRYLVVSIEIRKKKGQQFSPLKGLFKQYELMYVIADERDALLLRTNYRRDPVYLFKTTATSEQARALLTDMLRRAETLRLKPEFYNTAFSSCTTNIVQHLRRLFPGTIPLSYKILLPGYSGELAYKIGFLDTSKPFEELEAESLITPRALELRDREEYSSWVRSGGSPFQALEEMS
jgi:hypothetical protein